MSSERIFTQIVVSPDGTSHIIPADVPIFFPKSNLDISLQHYLAEIPWNEKYLDLVPTEFRDFFEYVLKYLHVRTTDVHTAICLGLLDTVLTEGNFNTADRSVVAILVDLDHLWSFTHENFWQSIVRQNLDPQKCIDQVTTEIDSYFVTDYGKQKARAMLAERQAEVKLISSSSL